MGTDDLLSRVGGNINSQLEYRADLDGLRAVAVVPVVLFHLGVTALPGGFVGVDVFFVLSGYLITSLLAADLKRGTFSLSGFYDRRIRRIVPALVVVLAFCTGAALLILFPTDLVHFGWTLTAAALSASNILFAGESGYFAPNADFAPLLHTWSLAVEEQFYILFPVLLWAVWRWARDWLAAIVWLILALSLALGVWGVWIRPTETFYLLPTRAWELLVGSVLALELVRKPIAAWEREFSAAAGLLAIAAAMVFFTGDVDFSGLRALLPCMGAALVIWAGMDPSGSETWTGRLLAAPILVFIGLISYSLYLWHWPLIVFAKHLTNGDLVPLQQLLLACAAMAFAVLSWRYIERPLRTGRWPWPRPSHRFALAGSVLLVLAIVGGGMTVAQGFPQRLSPIVSELAAQKNDFSRLRSQCHADGSARWTFDRTCVLGPSTPPMIIMFADSHGAELSVALSEAAKGRHVGVRQITASGCPPAVDYNPEARPECAQYVEGMLRGLLNAPKATIVIAAHHFQWSYGKNAGAFLKGFSSVVRSLRMAGHSVVLIGAVPPHPGRAPVPSTLARWVHYGGAAEGYRFRLDRRASAKIDDYLKSVARETGSVYVPLVPYLCSDGTLCRGYKDGTVMYFDDNHISVAGARRVTNDLIAPAIWSENLSQGFRE